MKLEDKNEEDKLLLLKDLLRLVYIHNTEVFPILDRENKYIGIINKTDILKLGSDLERLNLPFENIVKENLKKPPDKELLEKIMKLDSEKKIPVLDTDGFIKKYWTRREFFHVLNPQKQELNFFETIIDYLPVNFIVLDKKMNIKFASNRFLTKFEFDPNFIKNQRITKFFPKIKNPEAKLTDKDLKINYKHQVWYYNIINAGNNDLYIYTFSIEFSESDEETISIPANLPLTEIIELAEKKVIKKNLTENGWNITHTAEKLNIPRQTLQYKLQKYKLMQP